MSPRLFSLLLISFFFHVTLSYGQLPNAKERNILFLNSYHQGFEWSDSVTSGIIQVVKSNPKYVLYIENLQSKQFGQSHFETVKQYISQKYAGIPFDGVLVSDNDALDFAFRYQTSLFPEVPIVFAGISNPEDYPLKGSKFYGFKEIAPIDSILYLIRRILPDSKKLLVVSDNTTTGEIYRHQITERGARIKDLEIIMPNVIDLDSICQMAASGSVYDAIYYIGISQDKDGNAIDNLVVRDKIVSNAKVPLFSGWSAYLKAGVIGGVYQSGKEQGTEAAKLLIRLLKTKDYASTHHINTTGLSYFFDRSMLDRFGVSLKRLPKGAVILNEKSIFNKSNFEILIIILLLLSFIVAVLSRTNQKRKIEHQKSARQLQEIETQKSQLEEASIKLNTVISQLEASNSKLSETNARLFEAKKKAEESDKLKSAFLANVSHEIRTPLNSIVGFSSLLCESDLNDETKKTYSELIESNTESLLVLIDEIIDLSKIEAGQLTLKKEEFSVDELMLELFRIFSQNNSNVKVELKIGKPIEENLLYVYSDRVRLSQIFINLLSNAFKFTEEGSIEMGYSFSESQEIVFYVRDTGIGISKDHHQVIFHRFRKLNESTERIYRGTGLGLAITQKLVGLLGGKIWVESESGKGSAFYFTLQDCILK